MPEEKAIIITKLGIRSLWDWFISKQGPLKIVPNLGAFKASIACLWLGGTDIIMSRWQESLYVLYVISLLISLFLLFPLQTSDVAEVLQTVRIHHVKRNEINKRQNTGKPLVNDHPKSEGQVVTYREVDAYQNRPTGAGVFSILGETRTHQLYGRKFITCTLWVTILVVSCCPLKDIAFT